MKYTKELVSTLIIIIITFLLAAVLIIVAKYDPGMALRSFFYGIFGSLHGFAEIMVRATPLILAGLGVSVAFSTGFFNIGAEGQLYMGAIAITCVGVFLPPMPAVLHITIAITAGFLLGGIWAVIPGFLKAKYGVSEIITTIMFNYIAINIVGILVRTVLKNTESALPYSSVMPKSLSFPLLLYPTRLHGGFILAIVSAVLIYIIMKKTTIGYELRVVGFNKRAGTCSGISVYKNIVLASLISGGLAGLAGVSEIAGVHHRLLEGISPGYGYIAIIVALMGRNHPLGVIISAIGLSALQVGANSMQRQAGIPTSITSVLMGVIVLLALSKNIMFSGILKKMRIK
ncbi:MAG: ABC transporter permease [Candidatus Cloacimonetes bacterium]|nr:ABC transporter permease [Candidatus Cloacimonadota bacterium]